MIKLTPTHLKFLKEMLGIEDQEKAIQRFAAIMMEEKIDPSQMPQVIDRIIINMRKKVK